MAETPKVAASTRRRPPGTRWSAIRINWRWTVQALALVAGIYFFKRAFDNSKVLVTGFSASSLSAWSLWVVLFAISFLVLMFTSYIKERGSNTLRHRIVFFEKLVILLHLENYSESSSDNRPVN